MKTPQAPDVQGNSTDGLAGSLPHGSSTQGMTANTHPGQSMGDVHRGYDTFDPDRMTDQREGDEDVTPELQRGGVVGRPSGWER